MSKNYFKQWMTALVLLTSVTGMANNLAGRGQNMSFEDLTAQGGQQTGSVANVPTGWNAYINGTQIFTADDVRTGGVTAWFGVNDDSEGDAKDGNYAFGLWNTNVPRFELSQTISGLDNGTYIIKAGLMVGANDNGTRRTTQRIFGNHNARYFGSAEEYDTNLLDQSELYSFEGLEEPVTDRLLQEITVRVFVYDGTLTFGLRTDANLAAALREEANGAGGDGWFKVDNFRIEQADYQAEDALAVHRLVRKQAEDMLGQDMPETLSNELQKCLDQQLDASTSLSGMANAIQALKDICRRIQAAANASGRLQEALQQAYQATIVYDSDFQQLGNPSIDEAAIALLDLIDEAETLIEDGADDEDMDIMAQRLEDATRLLNKRCEPLEMARNLSFEDLTAQGGQQTGSVASVPTGWNAYINGNQVFTASDVQRSGVTVWFGVNDDSEGDAKDGNYSFGLWNGRIPRFELSQTIDGLDNGTYIVKAALMVGANDNGTRRTTQRIFGNLNARYFGYADDYDISQLDQSEAYTFEELEEPVTDRLLQEISVRAFVYDGTLTFGVRTDANLAASYRYDTNPAGGDGWLKIDNFRIEPAEYKPEDALAIYRHFLNQAKQTADGTVPQSLLVELSNIESRNINETSSQDSIISAIKALLDLQPKLKSAAREYARLEQALNKAVETLSTSLVQQGEQTAAATTLQATIGEATQMMQQVTATDEQVNAMANQLQQTTMQLRQLCLTTASILVDGAETDTELYMENWDGYWFNQNDEEMDKDVSDYDYVWVKYSNATSKVDFGIIYGEWVSTGSWSENYYTDHLIIEDAEGIAAIALEKQKTCLRGMQNTESPYWGDIYAKHVRQVYLQAQGAETIIDIDGIWFGTAEEYHRIAGNDDTAIHSFDSNKAAGTAVYDLTGRQIQGTLPPGLYISGGKKYIKR